MLDCGWEQRRSMGLVLCRFHESLFGNVSKGRMNTCFQYSEKKHEHILGKANNVENLPPLLSHQFAGNKALRDLLTHSPNALLFKAKGFYLLPPPNKPCFSDPFS